jgi:hypothetical protein
MMATFHGLSVGRSKTLHLFDNSPMYKGGEGLELPDEWLVMQQSEVPERIGRMQKTRTEYY